MEEWENDNKMKKSCGKETMKLDATRRVIEIMKGLKAKGKVTQIFFFFMYLVA